MNNVAIVNCEAAKKAMTLFRSVVMDAASSNAFEGEVGIELLIQGGRIAYSHETRKGARVELPEGIAGRVDPAHKASLQQYSILLNSLIDDAIVKTAGFFGTIRLTVVFKAGKIIGAHEHRDRQYRLPKQGTNHDRLAA